MLNCHLPDIWGATMKKIIFITLAMIAVLFRGTCVWAAQELPDSEQIITDSEGNLNITWTYESDSEEASGDILSEVEDTMDYDGKKYKLTETLDEVLSKKDVMTELTKVDKTDFLKEQEYSPAQTKVFDVDGSQYEFTLASVDYEAMPEQIQHISINQEFTGEDVPETMETEVTDERTGEKIDATLQLQDTQVTGSEWQDIQIPMTVYVYDAPYYLINGTRIEKDDYGNLDISGKEYVILDYLGLDRDRYEIDHVAWYGTQYRVDGELRRDARAYGYEQVDVINATYAADVEMPQLYTGIATYTAEVNTTGTYTYTHCLTAIYQVDYAMPFAFLSVGIAVLLAAVAVVLYIIAKKKNKKDTQESKQNG